MLWIEIVMEEYKAIKNEINTSIINLQTILNFGLAAIGVLILAGATLISQHEITSILFLLIIPIISYFILIIWLGELERLTRAGYAIRTIEKKINNYLGKEALIWEGWMRGVNSPERKNIMLKSNYSIVIFMFDFLALASCLIGLYILNDVQNIRVMILVITLELFANLIFTYFVLKRRKNIFVYKSEPNDELS
jgi:hypothetical protein